MTKELPAQVVTKWEWSCCCFLLEDKEKQNDKDTCWLQISLNVEVRVTPQSTHGLNIVRCRVSFEVYENAKGNIL